MTLPSPALPQAERELEEVYRALSNMNLDYTAATNNEKWAQKALELARNALDRER